MLLSSYFFLSSGGSYGGNLQAKRQINPHKRLRASSLCKKWGGLNKNSEFQILLDMSRDAAMCRWQHLYSLLQNRVTQSQELQSGQVCAGFQTVSVEVQDSPKKWLDLKIRSIIQSWIVVGRVKIEWKCDWPSLCLVYMNVKISYKAVHYHIRPHIIL